MFRVTLIGIVAAIIFFCLSKLPIMPIICKVFFGISMVSICIAGIAFLIGIIIQLFDLD